MFAHSFPQILFSFNLERGSEFSITVYKVMLIQLNKGRDLQQEQQATNNSTWRCSTLFFTFYEIERRSDRQREIWNRARLSQYWPKTRASLHILDFFAVFAFHFVPSVQDAQYTAAASCQLLCYPPPTPSPIVHQQLYIYRILSRSLASNRTCLMHSFLLPAFLLSMVAWHTVRGVIASLIDAGAQRRWPR